MATKSMGNQTLPHTNTPTKTKKALLQIHGCGSVLGGQLEQVSVLVHRDRCLCGGLGFKHRERWSDREEEGEAIWAKEALGAHAHGGSSGDLSVFING